MIKLSNVVFYAAAYIIMFHNSKEVHYIMMYTTFIKKILSAQGHTYIA